MPRTLDPGVTLRRERERIVLRRRTWRDARLRVDVHPLCAVILALLDGRRTEDEVEHIAAHVFAFTREAASRLMQMTLTQYRRFLVDSETLDVEPVAYNPADFVMPVPPPRVGQRLPVPQWISWRVTRYCNRCCRYCAMATRRTNEAPDAVFPFARAKEIFAEGADAGVRGVLLTGGEPFLRRDIVELIAMLVALDYELDVETKYALSAAQVGELAEAGLPSIRISLDSADPATANGLVGDPRFFGDITGTIQELIARGIRVTLAPIVTERNVRELPDLAELAVNLGVDAIKLNTFLPGQARARQAEALALSSESARWLHEALPALEQMYTGVLELVSETKGAPHACEQGVRALHMLPDGRVSRCNQWLEEEHAVFGDLRTQSLLEAWSSPALLIPRPCLQTRRSA